MKNPKFIIYILAIFTTIISIYPFITNNIVNAETQDFKKSIDEKSKELELINSQIQKTEEDLTKVATQKQTLSKELKKIDGTLNQVNLSIKASKVNIEKLGLEIDSLNDDIDKAEKSIEIKKNAIISTIQNLNKADKNGVLEVFLKSESLVEGARDIQSLKNVEDQLSVDVSRLKDLHEQLNQVLSSKEKKRGGIEQENLNLKVRKTLVEDQKQERKNLIVSTKNKEQIYQQQLSDLEKEQDAIAEEIEKLEYELRGRIDAKEIPAFRKGVLGLPVSGGIRTQGHGYTNFASKNYQSRYHNGIDIGKFLGAEIVSAEEGKVVAIGNQDKYCRKGYGKFIVIKHYNGLTTLYAHLSNQVVVLGQEVTRGQLIGYMGKTGWATGPHLHFTVYDTNTYNLKSSNSCGPMPLGGDINPNNYL